MIGGGHVGFGGACGEVAVLRKGVVDKRLEGGLHAHMFFGGDIGCETTKAWRMAAGTSVMSWQVPCAITCSMIEARAGFVERRLLSARASNSGLV